MPVKVVVFGSANMDLVAFCPHLPAPGETVLGTGFQMANGGKGANQAVGCVRLGAETWFVARLGQDSFGHQLYESFKREGIVTDLVLRDPDFPSGVALIFVDSKGQNQIVVAPGANGRLSPHDWQDRDDLWDAAKVLLIQLEIPIETVVAALTAGSEAGLVTILNPAPARPLPEDVWNRVAVCVPNEREAEAFSGVTVTDPETAATAGRWFLEKGVGSVVVTMGEKGSVLVTPTGWVAFPAFPVSAVDATAAGDAFCAGLAVRLAEGAPISDATRFANAAGALSCIRTGAQPSLPRRNEVEAFLQSHQKV